MKFALAIVLLVVGSCFLGQSGASGPIYAQASEVVVAQSWVSALNRGDTGAALALLNDDSVLIIEPSQPEAETAIYTGKDEIRAALQRYLEDNFHTELLATPEAVNGTTSWTEKQSSDSLRRSGIVEEEVRADALIEAGKIKSLIYEPVSASEGEEATPTAGINASPSPAQGGPISPTHTPTPTPASPQPQGSGPTATAPNATAAPLAQGVVVTPTSPSVSPVPPRATASPPGPKGPTGMPRTGAGGASDVAGALLILGALIVIAGGVIARASSRKKRRHVSAPRPGEQVT